MKFQGDLIPGLLFLFALPQRITTPRTKILNDPSPRLKARRKKEDVVGRG